MNRIRTYFAAFVMLLTLAPAFAQWQTPTHSVPIGRGAGVMGFGSVPTGVFGTCLSGNGSLADPTFAVCGISVPTVAALKALTPPTTAAIVYVQGYASPGDGGEGWVTYNLSSTAADDGGTTFIPAAAPATGRWQRERQSTNGAVINARWFGAQCGAATATNTAAFAAAFAVAQVYKSGLYFPGCSAGSFYSGNISGLNTSVSLLGDGLGSQIVGAFNTITVDLTSNVGCGGVHDFTVRGLYIGASGASGVGLHIKNAGWISVENSRVDGPAAISLECVSQGVISGVQGYSSSGAAIQITSGGSNSGPLAIHGGQYTSNGGTTPAIVIVEPLAIEFAGVAYNSANGTQTASISVDGGGGSSVGSVTFKEMHAESNYNTASTASDYAIGCAAKAGSVKIEGGNSWGLGDGAHSQQDFVRLCDARNVEVSNVVASKLGGTGYTRSMIRVENTYTGTYDLRGNVADVSGARYSDATGKLTGQTGDANNSNQDFVSAFSLSGTITPPALSGDVNDYNPTGQSTATAMLIDGGAANRNITGFVGGLNGRLLTVINAGTTNPLIIKNESASSSAINRMTVGLDITIDPNKSLTLRYDGTTSGGRWRPWDSIYSSVSVPISRTLTMTAPLLCDGATSCDLSVNRTVSLGANGITNALFRTSGALSIVGRSANSGGSVADISAVAGSSCVFLESASSLICGQVATAGIVNNAVDNTKIRAGIARSVVGVTGNAGANVADIQGAASQWFGVNSAGTAAAFMTMAGDCTGAVPSIVCTKTNGVVFASSAVIDTTNAANISSGTLPAGRLPNPSASTLGGVQSAAAVAHQWINSISTSGVPALSQPAFSDISGTAAVAQGGTACSAASGTCLDNITGFGTTGFIRRTGAGTYTFTGPIGAGASVALIDGTLVVASGKTATFNNTMTFTGTDGIIVPIGAATHTPLLSGTNLTYTTPTNAKSLRFRMVGGGGGGAPYIAGVAAGSGGDTCWNTSGTACTTPLFKAGGGAAASVTSKGAGGTATSCTPGFPGGNGSDGSAVSNSFGGNGGVSAFGGNGWGGNINPGGAASTNSGSGGGGSGSAATAQTGGGGGAGAYCEAIITSPAATYVYTVGAAGTAGTGTVNGGAGAAGFIMVDEFYNLMAKFGWHGEKIDCDNDNWHDFCKAM